MQCIKQNNKKKGWENMYLAWMGYLMILTFMILIMTKKLHAFNALLLVPVIFGVIACIIAGVPVLEVGNYCADGIKSMAKTFSLLLFAIIYFGTMISVGLFDPAVNKLVKLMHGDPARVLVFTSIMAALVSMDGDGTTTTLICCTALVPVYNKLGIKKIYLAGTILLQNTVMNLLPWGGPTARVIAVLELEAGELFRPLIPGMILAALFNIAVAYYIGLKERKRLGIINIDVSELQGQLSEEDIKDKRPKLFYFNLILTLTAMVVLIFGWVPSNVVFAVATALALCVNYRDPKDQKRMIDDHGADAIQVVVMIIAAGVLMGVLDGTGMSEAMANHMASLIPSSMNSHYAFITALISCAGTFFLSNDAYYYGVLPVLAQTGYAFGFTPLTMGLAACLGQAFHLISPLVGFLYLLLKLTDVSLVDLQKYVGKWAIGIFVCFMISAMVLGIIPL